jgi:RND superfamily putative drug exporter
MISLPVMLVLLFLVFGGVLAAGLPVLVAVVAMASTLVMLALASAVADISVYSVNIVTMLGLGLAVDYALLLVTRFREERSHTPDVMAALDATMGRAGRTVAFSGLTVAASLAGLLVFPDDFLRSMGLAGMSVVALDMLAALTLVPALLATFGRRLRPRPVAPGTGGFFATARFAQRHRLPVLAIAGSALVVCALPFLGAQYADPDERSLPESSQSRQLAALAETSFPGTATAEPVTLVAPGMSSADARALSVEAAGLDDVRDVVVRAPAGGSAAVVDVVPDADGEGPVTSALVAELRALVEGEGVLVTGDAAELVDYERAVAERIPWALAVIVVTTFALLFLFTGSLVVPVKALLLNTLSLGAAFGALVWVFQDGHLGGLVGTEALGSLSITTPVLVFAIAFGLSMDYEVFLLGRITEEWRRTGDTDGAVATAVARTGRVVTAAALLMIVVYAGFVAGGFSPVKQVGLGLVLAVAVDATVVRLLLLPAAMSLMGRANWWAPAVLRGWHDRHGLAEAAEVAGAPSGAAAEVPSPTTAPALRR